MRADFAVNDCRKEPPFAPPFRCRMRGGSESARKPTLLFELDRTLLRLNAHTPAFEPLFQLPLEIGHMLRRFPLLLVTSFAYDPSADHSAQFVDQSIDCHVTVLGEFRGRIIDLLAVFELEVTQ